MPRIYICLYLEKIVFEEIAQRFVIRYLPPGIMVEIDYRQEGDQNEGAEFGFVADRYKDHDDASNYVLENLKR